jgi:hypothetical protein
VVAGVVAMTLFGAGTAVIAATGPFAVIFAAVIGFAALSMGKEELMQRHNDYNVPKMLRQVRSEAAMKQKLRVKAAVSEAELAASLAAEFERSSCDRWSRSCPSKSTLSSMRSPTRRSF